MERLHNEYELKMADCILMFEWTEDNTNLYILKDNKREGLGTAKTEILVKEIVKAAYFKEDRIYIENNRVLAYEFEESGISLEFELEDELVKYIIIHNKSTQYIETHAFKAIWDMDGELKHLMYSIKCYNREYYKCNYYINVKLESNCDKLIAINGSLYSVNNDVYTRLCYYRNYDLWQPFSKCARDGSSCEWLMGPHASLKSKKYGDIVEVRSEDRYCVGEKLSPEIDVMKISYEEMKAFVFALVDFVTTGQLAEKYVYNRLEPQCLKCRKYKENKSDCYVQRMAYKYGRKYLEYVEECADYESLENINISCISPRKKRLYGGIMGLCVGDMFGFPLIERSFCKNFEDMITNLREKGHFDQPFGTWSYSTSYMLMTMDAAVRGLTASSIAENIRDFYFDKKFTANGEIYGINRDMEITAQKINSGVELKELGENELNKENGWAYEEADVLARVFPLAFIRKKYDDASYIRLIKEVVGITNASETVKVLCMVYTVYASELYEGKEKNEAYEAVFELLSEHHCEERMKSTGERNFYNRLKNRTFEPFNHTSDNVSAILKTILYIFLETDSYEQAVIFVANTGLKQDIATALIGGLAGIYYGYKKINDRWIQNLAKKKEIKELADKFAKVCLE